jgi:hypothetical protein
VADIGRKARREAAHGAKADKPKRYEPPHRLQDSAAERPTFAPETAGTDPPLLALPMRGAHAHPVNNIAATLVIRERLRQHLLPHHEPWRRQGEYAGGCLCDGCGEGITSAQASYEVDFAPGVMPQSLRLHRACFEIWLSECQPLS